MIAMRHSTCSGLRSPETVDLVLRLGRWFGAENAVIELRAGPGEADVLITQVLKPTL